MSRTAISALDRIMVSKVLASITSSRQSSAQMAVALRGLLLRMAISPRNSPGPRRERIFSTSPTRLVMVTLPALTTNISRPSSPSRKRTVPRGNSRPKRWKRGSSDMWGRVSSLVT